MNENPRYFLELVWRRKQLPMEVATTIMKYASPKTIKCSDYVRLNESLRWINNYYCGPTKILEITINPQNKRITLKNQKKGAHIPDLFRENLKCKLETIIRLLDYNNGYFDYGRKEMDFTMTKGKIQMRVYL